MAHALADCVDSVCHVEPLSTSDEIARTHRVEQTEPTGLGICEVKSPQLYTMSDPD